MPPTPLQIATQEYAYWRSFDLKDSATKAPETFTAVLVGAIGAAANITSRLAGFEAEGIDYESLSPEQITKILIEIRLAPRLAQFVKDFREAARYVDGEIPALNKALTEALLRTEADTICAELEKAGAL